MLSVLLTQCVSCVQVLVVACHNGSVPRWLRATCWNGHREARATYTRYGWEGLGCQWLAGLDGKGWGVGDRLPMVRRVSL